MNTTITVKEAQQKRDELAQVIRTAIETFERDTGVEVSNVRLERTIHMSSGVRLSFITAIDVVAALN